MTIAALDAFESSLRRTVRIYSGQWPSNIAPLNWASQILIQSDPGALGTLANTPSGAVPVAGDAGFPSLGSSGGAQCYLSRVRASQLAATSGGSDYGRLFLYDRLFHVGEIGVVSSGTTTLSSQPSYAARLPGGSYVGTQIWVEVPGSGGASISVNVTYTNQAGTTGRATGVVPFGISARYMWQMPLQAGDTGVQKIESVIVGGGGGGAGTINVIVARPLWFGFLPPENGYYSEVEAVLDALSLPAIYETSALAVAYMRTVSSLTNPQIELLAEIAS